MSLSLGGTTVELVYVGLGHSDNMIVMRFPAEKTLFVVDIVTVDRVPFQDLRNIYIDHWIAGLKQQSGLGGGDPLYQGAESKVSTKGARALGGPERSELCSFGRHCGRRHGQYLCHGGRS